MQAYVSIAWHVSRCLNAPRNLYVDNAIRNITPASAMLSSIPLNLFQGHNPPQQSLPTPAVTTSTDHVTPPTVTTTAQTVSTITQSEDTPTAASTTSLSVISTSVSLLKTTTANVSAGQTTVEGHILFDEGTQRSFITQELANQLQLKLINHKQISVSSFGEQISAFKRLAVASISIQTLNKGHVPTSVLIVPKLAAPIHNSVQTHLDKLPYLQGFPLAHPVTSDENFQISILIRADFYQQFI